MKGHRARGKARRVVVAGYGRTGHPRLGVNDHQLVGAIEAFGSFAPVLRAVTAPSIIRSAKEKQRARTERAIAKETPPVLFGRAVRKLREEMRKLTREAT